MTTRKSIKGNIWRELLARAIEDNGGYYANHDKVALAWNVKIHAGVEDLAEYTGSANFKDNMPDEVLEDKKLLKEAIKLADWNKDHVWQWALDDVREGVSGNYAADTYRSMTPARFNHFGLIEAKGGTYFDVEFSFCGRSGGYICIKTFEGVALGNISASQLAESLREPDHWNGSEYPNAWCQKLVAFIAECDEMFTREKAEAEFSYQIDYMAARAVEDAVPKARKKLAAKRLRKAVIEAARTLTVAEIATAVGKGAALCQTAQKD